MQKLKKYVFILPLYNGFSSHTVMQRLTFLELPTFIFIKTVLRRTVYALHDNVPNVDRIITGHGPLATWAELEEWASFNRDFLEMVRSGRAAGRSVDDLASSWSVPAEYAGYAEEQVDSVRQNIQVIVDELEG